MLALIRHAPQRRKAQSAGHHRKHHSQAAHIGHTISHKRSDRHSRRHDNPRGRIRMPESIVTEQTPTEAAGGNHRKQRQHRPPYGRPQLQPAGIYLQYQPQSHRHSGSEQTPPSAHRAPGRTLIHKHSHNPHARQPQKSHPRHRQQRKRQGRDKTQVGNLCQSKTFFINSHTQK